MAKKSFFFIFAFLFASLLISFVLAANIGYVVKTPSPVNSDEAAIINLLEENGNDVKLLDNVLFNFNLYDIIIVGEDVTSIKGIFDNKNHKTIFLSQSAAKYAGLSIYSGSTSSNKITISDNDSIITDEFLLGDLTIYKSLDTISYVSGCKAINSKSLAYKSSSYQSVILLLGKDSLLLDETENCNKRDINISERNLFFGLPRASQWNDNAKIMFLNSIEWVTYGDDADKDGYYSEEDCNDFDSDKWQLLGGYLDNDNDGYGTGNLLEACSGDELSEGYSAINGDCDDNDEEKNPGAEEMQFDEIDQNCDNAAEFSVEIPDIGWNEDEKISFDLNSYVWNPYGDELVFYIYSPPEDEYISIRIIENGIANFSSAKDWNGEDWIVFGIYDESKDIFISSNKVNLKVLPVNDAPEIRSYNPKSAPKLLENTSQIFSVVAFDADLDVLEIKWLLDGAEVADGSFYNFNKEKGNYEVKVKVSDSEFEDENAWNVFVGDISGFTCQEVDGHVIVNNEICMGDLLGTSDSNLISCCSIPGSPKFSDADRCENLAPSLKIKIEEPNKNEEFKILDDIKGKIKIENDFDEDLDFDLNIYLYDLTNDEEIDNYEDSVSVDKDKSKNLDFKFTIPEDLDEKDDYAIFARVTDDNEEYCNEAYVRIDIEREENDVFIKGVEMNPEIACGDYFEFKIKVVNRGSEDQDVYLAIENSELNINEKSEEFELEEYGKDDTETKIINFKIPESATEGNYEIEIKADFGEGENSVTKNLLIKCKKVEEKISEIKRISLQSNNSEAKTNANNKNPIIILSIIMLSALIIIIVLLKLKGGKNDY